jgi:hypothetical protein
MSIEAERNTVATAEKKLAEEPAAAAAAMTANWPTGGYNLFIPLLFITVFTLLVVCVDESVICVVRACMVRYQYEINTVNAMFMIYFWIKLIKKLLIY